MDLLECESIDYNIEVQLVVETVESKDSTNELRDFITFVWSLPLNYGDYIFVKTDERGNGILTVQLHDRDWLNSFLRAIGSDNVKGS